MSGEQQQTRVKLAMNVKGITPTLFEAGKIKIGRKGKEKPTQGGGTFQMPEKLDSFLMTRTMRGQDNNFMPDQALMDLLPKDPDGKIRRIPITLLYDDLALNFQSRYACYLGSTLFCSGDGEFANQAVKDKADPKKVAGYKQVPCTCPRAEFGYEGQTIQTQNGPKFIRDKCKITGKLQCIIRGAERIGGVYVFRTTGRNSVVSILSSLAMVQRITGGFLAGIPLDLVVSPKQVADPDGKQQTVYVVAVEFAGSMQALQDQAHKFLLSNEQHRLQIQRIENEARALLTANPAPFGDDLDDDDDAPEFFPHTQGQQVELVDTSTGEVTVANASDSPLVRSAQPGPINIDDAISQASQSAPVITPEQQTQTRARGGKKAVTEQKPTAAPAPAPVEKEQPLRNQEQLTDEDFQQASAGTTAVTSESSAPADDDEPF